MAARFIAGYDTNKDPEDFSDDEIDAMPVNQAEELKEIKENTEMLKLLTERKIREKARIDEKIAKSRKKIKALPEENPRLVCSLELSLEAGAGESGKEMSTASPTLEAVFKT